ncbi:MULTISPECIES: xanthine dehydrogenase small subunit [Pseudomonas]|uniref:Xanthine dehydrogenase small subunit n=1 Tax=Pseudomonas oryzihabitans TaxID=47885 RepID=A0A2Z5AC23_9PSED|nr:MULTISPECIES: xanthine dehydrogenase small subunit [Pseudomonas]AXA67506.1 xanthine dehydrogenase small subunit [Pseudomonas oryzihabitans]
MIRFLLDQELRSEEQLDPNLTVLQYLRERCGKTGTKEGCASGDCGACTVVLAEPDGDRLRYRTVNSCLTFVAALDGRQLISVEDLKHRGRLHQVQQAMVDCHGSQCGYCTPGFVMSLFALQKNVAAPDDAATHEALAGNLCRCTGYRPILAAAEQACAGRQPDQFDAREQQTLERLQALAPMPATRLEGDGRRCHSPTSLSELASLYLTHPEARLLAGGTDLALEVTQQHRRLETLIYLGNLPELRGVTLSDEVIEIGAATPLADCTAALAADYPDFGALLQRFASLQIRNQGTLGGNIGNASPIGDSPPLLLALGASVLLRQGERLRELALDDFFLDYRQTALEPGEFIQAVRVPRSRAGLVFRAFKVSKRLDDDISAVCAAFALELEQDRVASVRIAYGGMAATPRRAARCEQALLGEAWNAASIERAVQALAEDFAPLSDFRASREYRLLTAQNLLRKCHLETTQPALATRVTAHV